MDQADPEGGEDGSQRDAGSEGDGLSNCLHRASDAAREISAERWQRVRRHIPTTQCSPGGRTTNSPGHM